MTARDHGSSLDTLRWGDVETVIVGSTGELLSASTKQLVQAHWRWPLSWTVQFSFVANFGTTAPAETVTFLFDVEFTVGVGQGKMTWVTTYTMVPSAPNVYPNLSPQVTIPAQDLQIRVRVRSSANPTGVAGENFLVGCMVAPVTEPHAMTEALRVLEGEPRDEVEWMGPGFTPQPLHYRR
jgi:hypothetical protein